MNATERIERAKLGAHSMWAKTPDRTARTANLRAGFEEKWFRQARELHPGADDKTIAQAAESLRQAHFVRMRMAKAAKSRAKKTQNSK